MERKAPIIIVHGSHPIGAWTIILHGSHSLPTPLMTPRGTQVVRAATIHLNQTGMVIVQGNHITLAAITDLSEEFRVRVCECDCVSTCVFSLW